MTGKLEDADPRRYAEALDPVGSGDDEDRGIRSELDERLRDGQVAADVAEPRPVVRVEEETAHGWLFSV